MALSGCADSDARAPSRHRDDGEASGAVERGEVRSDGVGVAEAEALGAALRRGDSLHERLEEAREQRRERMQEARERLEAARERREQRAEEARERRRRRREAVREARERARDRWRDHDRLRDHDRDDQDDEGDDEDEVDAALPPRVPDAGASAPDAAVPPVRDAAVLDAGHADGGRVDAGPDGRRAMMCPPARSTDRIPQRTSTSAVATATFEDVRRGLRPCAACHLAPAQTGGFSFQDAYRGGVLLLDGESRSVPGIAEVGPRMAEALADGWMPPASLRQQDEAGYAKLGALVAAWIAAGSPEEGSFPLSGERAEAGPELSADIGAAMTDLGDCIPAPALVGTDAPRDAMFAGLTALPDRLADTDLVTLDAYELAQRGTVGYDVEYPLWADNAHKGRWVHVPTTLDAGGTARRTPIRYLPDTKRFAIPDDTRFYKTFFKAVKEADGIMRYRKVETRLIVVRHAPRTPLFGTYVWNEAETSATLLKQPYRSGQPFKDLVLSLEVDVATHARRTYAVPAAHRCNECHQGSESDSFILGFTPLQVHRRALGEAGRQTPTAEDELSQLARLLAYGVVADVTPKGAPLLEQSNPTAQPRNVHELRFQAYATGNCAHCHNPKGYATKQNAQLRLNLAPGNVINFPVGTPSIYNGTYITSTGNPAQSLIYNRMVTNNAVDGLVPLLHMPLHTPGVDCDGIDLAGKWISSIPNTASALAAAESFTSPCKPQADVQWLEEDFTEPPVYAPRRADWNDPRTGIPANLRALEFTEGLEELARTPIATGYWLKRTSCQFPTVVEPPGGARAWMLDASGAPRRPFGEIFYSTPGASYFSGVCQKCHGALANGDSGMAKTIATLTGGQTRVANLRDGLFGKRGANLQTFDVLEAGGARNLSGNYLIWMASGGTSAVFPAQLRELVGSHGANMLNQVRETCASLLPGARSPIDASTQEYELHAKVCTYQNPITPELGYDPDTHLPLHAELQEPWLERAAQNAGWTLFRFFKEEAAQGIWPASPSDCESRFKKP